MADGERRQRVITSTPRISPEEIANRAFGSSFRGYAEHEVRAFLGRVAEELTSAREREEQILMTLDDLEEQLRAPKPLDEQELLEALGEETARLLRAAREASADIRRKAEERSASVMEEAQTEAHRLRTDAAEILAVRSQEAEGVAAEIVGDAEARAAEIRAANEAASEDQRQRAEEEAVAIVESSRIQGREMLDEARIARERVLTDLGRRRSLLQAQIEELRQGRDRLLDAYRVVKRTFLDATEALSQVEARAAADRAQANAAAPAGQIDVGDIEGTTAGAGEFDDLSASEATAPSSDLPDVDSLFARLRAGQDPDEAPEPEAGKSSEPEAVESSEPEATAPAADEPAIDEPAIGVPAIGVVEGGVLEEEPLGAESDSSEVTEPEHRADPHSRPESDSAQEVPTAADAWRSRHIAAVEPLHARSRAPGQADGSGRAERVAGRSSPLQGAADGCSRCSPTTTRRSRRGRACCARHSTRRTPRDGMPSVRRPSPRPSRCCAKPRRASRSRCASASDPRSTMPTPMRCTAWSNASAPATANGRTNDSNARWVTHSSWRGRAACTTASPTERSCVGSHSPKVVAPTATTTRSSRP